MATITVGQTIRLSAQDTVSSTPTDPSSITVSVTDPSLTTTVYTTTTAPAIVRDGVGQYHLDLMPSLTGSYTFVWTASGTGAAMGSGTFSVAANPILQAQILSPPTVLPSLLACGLAALTGNLISVAGVPVLIFAPSGTVDAFGNVLPAEYVPQNLNTTIYANIVTDQESQDAANALSITSPRPAYAYIQSIAGPMLFNRGMIYDGSNYWLMHQTPVPYQMGIGAFVWRVLVTQQQQTPAGIP